MTSYGDVRKIIEDVILITKTLEGMRDAEKEIGELVKETETLSRLANDIEKNGNNLERNKDFQDILKETHDCIADLKKHLEKKKRKTNTPWGKFKWAVLQKSHFEQALQKAHRLSNLLSQMDTTLSIRDLSDAQRDKIVHDFINAWTPRMADALFKAYPRVQVTEGTGGWIQEIDQYQDWEQSQNGLLWINGIQGCGKTGLAITIDDRFRASVPSSWSFATGNTQQPQFSSTVGIATIFCYHQIDGMRQLEDHMEILMSLWSQLVKSKPECRPHLAWIREAKGYHQSGTLTGQRRVAFQKDLLKYALKHSGDTILILDGLDEIPIKLQSEVIRDLRSLQSENDHCRILITSRPYESIARIFKKDPQVYMVAPDIDLTLYMEERFSRYDWDDHNEFKSHEIIDILLPKCQKMFLLTQLLMDEVVRAESKAHCERIISELPKTVNEAYRRGLNRLKSEYSSEGLMNHLPCMAIQALFWVAFAKSPMTGDQLAHALSIAESGTDSDSKVQMWRERGIDSRTGKLVVVYPENGQLVIAHKTLTEYLTKDDTRSEFFPRIREHMHEVQLDCLLGHHNKSRVLGGTKEEFFEQFPLLTYALSNWGTGLASVLVKDTSLWNKTEAFLATSFHEWNQFCKDQIIEVFTKKADRWANPRHVFTHEFFTPGSIEGLYWVVFFDLQQLVPSWIESSTDCLVKDPAPTTPLGFAAGTSNTPMMALLLKHNAQVNLDEKTNSFVKPPLHDAVWQDDAAATENLLHNGADMTSRRGVNDKSPLDLIYNIERGSAARILASHISDSNGIRAQELQFLVRTGRTKHLEEIIQKGMDINLPCENGKRALDYALEMGNQGIAELLKKNGAIANLSWPAQKIDPCPYPVNLREPGVTPLVSKEHVDAEDAFLGYRDAFQNELKLEIPVDSHHPIRSIVFETITADQGWSDYRDLHHTYIGSNRSRLDVVLSNQGVQSESFVLQENLHASRDFRLHTNIWNLSELEVSSPQRAKLIRDIKYSSVLQIFARAWGSGWENRVKYIRVRMYGEEIHPIP